MKLIIKGRQQGKTFGLVKQILERNNDKDILFVKTSKQIDNIKNMIKSNDELTDIIVKNNNIEDFSTLKEYIDNFCDNKIQPFCNYIGGHAYNREYNCFIDDAELCFSNCKAMSFSSPKENVEIKNKNDILELIKIIREGYHNRKNFCGHCHDLNTVSFEIGELLVKIEKELNK